jgi:hypothetical protein
MATRIVPVLSKSQTNARFRKTARSMARRHELGVCVRGNKQTGYTASAICGLRIARGPGDGLARYLKPSDTLGLCDLSDTFTVKSDAMNWITRKIGVTAVAAPTGKLEFVNTVSKAA